MPPNNNDTQISIGSSIASIIFLILSAAVSLFVWILGVGIDRTTHNSMGLFFVGANLFAIGGVVYFLRKRRNGTALILALCPTALVICSVILLAIVCSMLGNTC